LDFWHIFLLFLAFCITQLFFNVIWLILQGKIAKKQLNDKIDAVIAQLARKLARKGGNNGETNNDNL